MPLQKSETKQPSNFTFEAIGTVWSIDIWDGQSDVLQDVHTLIDEYDQVLSRFRTDSIVSQISQQAGSYKFPEYTADLFNLYEKMFSVTQGLVTPCIGQTLSDAGYDASYTFKQTTPLTRPINYLEVVDVAGSTLHARKSVLLEYGAAGKGHLVDLIHRLLDSKNIESFCVDAGGDMSAHLNNPMTIGLENPTNTEQVIGTASVSRGSICGSAGNRRKWGKYQHIINPQTLQSPDNILAVWTYAKTTMLADGMATCLYFVEPEKLQQQFNFEYVMVFSDGHAKISKNFPGMLF